jgi:hypothetical protein
VNILKKSSPANQYFSLQGRKLGWKDYSRIRHITLTASDIADIKGFLR